MTEPPNAGSSSDEASASGVGSSVGGAPSRERRAVALVCLALIGSCAGATLAMVIARLAGIAPIGPTLGGALAGIVGGALGRERLARRLPGELDGWFARRRIVRWVWIVAAVLAVGNLVRVEIFVADPAQTWASVFPPVPESADHQCLSAYVRAGELAARGHADLWNIPDYAAKQSTAIDGLAPYLGDPYEYPPPFAVLPRAAIAATDDYQLLRELWFGLSAVGCFAAFVALAMWARSGRALLLAPAIALSTPVLFGLQWGQAHVLVVAAAIGAMIAFARQRTIAGAALLAFAIATKIFPGLLLVHLAVRRQWRAIAATFAMLAAMVVLAAVVLGTGPLHAFVTEHLPRMASGEAFSYVERNPDNHSLYGLAFKLDAMGLDVPARQLGAILLWVWTALALVLTIRASRRRDDAALWLGIVCLATLRSPFAPTYTAIGTLWLLAIRPWRGWVVIVAWILLQGFPPLGSAMTNAIASLPSQAITIAIAIAAVTSRASGSRAPS